MGSIQEQHAVSNNVSYPGFGTKADSQINSQEINKVLDVALTALGVLSLAVISAGAGALTGVLVITATPLLPVAVAVGSFGLLITSAFVIRAIYDKVVNDPKRYLLKKEIIDANEAEAPKVGEYCKADLKVCNCVDKCLELKKELIRSATQSIECSFNFAGGEKLREFLSIIDERMSLHKDLKVHLMVSRDLLESEDFTMLEEYKKKYPDRFHYLITDRLTVLTPFIRTEENHVKLLVVDGKYFALGGSGVQANMTREKPPEDDDSVKTFAEYFIERSFKDTDLFGKASADKEKNVAACMRGQFYNLYQIWAKRMGVDLCEGEGVKFDVNPNTASCPSLDSGEGVHRNQEIKFIVSGPEHRGENPIETELSSMIGSAKKRVNIGNLLFNPAKPIAEALREVKKRNQQVKLVGHFNGKGPGSSLINYVNIWPSRPSYRLLDEVYESQALKQYYHRKVVTVDDEAAFVGSYNLGQKSSLCDYEVGCAIRSKGITKDINDALNGDKLGAKRIYTGPRWNDYSATVGFLAQSTLGNLAG